MVIGRFGFVFALALAPGCGAGGPVASTDCSTESGCIADPESATGMVATTTEAVGAEPNGSPGRLVDAIGQTELSGAPTTGESSDSRAGESWEDSSESVWRDLVDSQQIEFDGWLHVKEESPLGPFDSPSVVDGLLGSIGFRSEDIPKLLSLTLDGMLLETLGGGSSSSSFGPSVDETPGRFPTFLELLCREEGYSDSFCRQRYGY